MMRWNMHGMRTYVTTRHRTSVWLATAKAAAVSAMLLAGATSRGAEPAASDRPLDQQPDTWVLRSPTDSTPPSPRLGYEGACAWDSMRNVMIRYGGHNQGGGGEQGSEIWLFDPLSARWALKLPNTSPPGICCGQQNVFDPVSGRYLRFPAFSGNHGWQWFREIYLNDASVWSYDAGTNTWRNMRPVPSPHPRPLRCASWDVDHQVVVLFGGEGNSEGTVAYDPYTNEWTRMGASPQPEFRSGGNMAFDQAAGVHVLFGSQFSDDPHTWTYNLRTNEWRDMHPAEMPPTDKNDAVLCYDARARRVVAIAKVTTDANDEEKRRHRLETWLYDTAENRWTKADPPREPDPSGNRARQLMFAPELGMVVLENRVERGARDEPEQQVWTYRSPDSGSGDDRPLSPPRELRVVTEESAASLQWESPAVGQPDRLVVERGTGERPWQVQYEPIAELKGESIRYDDNELRRGTVYYYRVRAVWGEGENAREAKSNVARSQPPVVDDLVVSVAGLKRIELRWSESAGDDVTGYIVERAVVDVLTEDQLARLKSNTPPLDEPSAGAIRRIGEFSRVSDKLIAETECVDESVDLSRPALVEGEPAFENRFHDEQLDAKGKPYRYAVYAYRVRAVNRLGTVGGASAAVLTIPAAPQFVFSREDGETCRLKWEAAPRSNRTGYRVYRMDGRYSDAKISRLTPDPIEETKFADETAGNSTRRYYVVAVDALGQEGFPSSPVWYRREWEQFYEPFVDEWHQ